VVEGRSVVNLPTPYFRPVKQKPIYRRRRITNSTLTSIMLFCSIASFPLYLFPSGLPQISHVFFACFLLLFVNKLRRSTREMPNATKSIFRPLLCFAGFIAAIQLLYSVTLGEPELMLHAVFVAFNILYCLSIYHYFRVYPKFGMSVVLLATISAAVILFASLVLGLSAGDYRKTGSFNNPNQLGYFSLLIILMASLFRSCGKLLNTRLYSTFLVFVGVYGAVSSLSKAALISSAFGVLVFARRMAKGEIIMLVVALLCLSPLLGEKVFQSNAVHRVRDRVGSIGYQSDDTLGGRGYKRIVEFSLDSPVSLLFGSGEGAYWRFSDGYSGGVNEIHSTPASIVFCYGVVGLAAFALFNYRCWAVAPRRYLESFVAIYFYGLTHNGLRFGFFWLLFALYIYLSENRKADEQGAV